LDMMGGMVEAQRLRDARFARAALEALSKHGAPVVVVTGNGHARRDWGIPHMIGLAAPELAVFSVGFLEGADAADDRRFDAVMVADAPERGDPCAAFRQ